MTLESIQLDSENLAMELLPELERRFGVVLDGDLGHVRTAGDLFDAIVARRPVAETRTDTETGMAFYALRRALVPLWHEENPTPLTALADKELPLPKRLRKLLERQTRWAMPRPPISMFGLLVAVALAAGALYEIASAQMLPGIVLAGLCVAALVFEPGEFTGDWATLGSLAREVTDMNFTTLADGGARETEAANWRVFVESLARHVLAGRDAAAPSDIGRDTLLRFS